MRKAGVTKIFSKDIASSPIRHPVSPFGIEQIGLSCISGLQPLPQGIPGIITKIDNPCPTILHPLLDGDGALLEIDITELGLQKLPDSHTRSQKHQNLGTITAVGYDRKKPFYIIRINSSRQVLR